MTHWGKEGHQGVVVWPLLWAIHLTTDAQLVAEEKVRKLEGKLQLEKDWRLPTSHLASKLMGKIETQDTQIKTLVCHFVCLGGCKIWWPHVRAVFTQLDWDAKTWNQWETTSDTKNNMEFIFGDEEKPEPLLLRQK